jgi:putative transposase
VKRRSLPRKVWQPPLEDYAVKKRVAPSAALEAAIDELLSEGLGNADRLAEVGRLGARLVLQRALEEEVADFLGRARYERAPEALGSRNGVRPRWVQTGEGELEVQMPQLRDTGCWRSRIVQ